MATSITEISFSRPVIEQDGTLTPQGRSFFRVITDRALKIGIGSPDGVVPGVQAAFYMDESALAGSIIYVKQKANIAGDDKFGWVLIG